MKFFLQCLMIGLVSFFFMDTANAQDDNEIQGVFVDDQGRKYPYIQNQLTGKAVRIFPNLNALDFSGGKAIGEGNVEQVARNVLKAVAIFSGVDHDELTLARASETKQGMWIVSFDQEHRGIEVYNARYGVTIGRNNTVLSIGGDFYEVSGFSSQGTVTDHASPVQRSDLDIESAGPIGPTGNVGNDPDPDLQVSPTISKDQVIRDLLGDSEDAAIVAEPELVIFPQMDDNSITYKIGWFASVDDGIDSREVVVDAFSGTTLTTESLVAEASYSREGTVEGLIHPHHDTRRRQLEGFENLKVQAVNVSSGQRVDYDETDTDGDYSLSWTGATATYAVGAELEGEYVRSVTDVDRDNDLDHWFRFSSPTKGTYNWTFDNSIPEDGDQLNIFYHTNKIARWFDDEFFNVRFKVDLVSNSRSVRSNAHAHCRGGSTPKIEFSGHRNSERQSDTIYHEYVHAVIYKMHNRFIGSSGQGRALDEGMADYFACSFLNDSTHEFAGTALYRELNPHSVKKYPRDYNSTSSPYQRGLIPAGACWDLRIDLGQSSADEIIFAALEMDSPRANTFQRFFDNVLLADDDLNGNGTWNWKGCSQGGDKSPHAGEIWEAFGATHGMPSGLLSEDPDCPSSKPKAQQAAVEAAEGAYPNPFNSSVNLRYHLNEPGRVDVAVYSITGQLVRHLLSEDDVQPGSYSVAWDGLSDRGAQVASGMYLVRVKSPSLVKSFKLSLVR